MTLQNVVAEWFKRREKEVVHFTSSNNGKGFYINREGKFFAETGIAVSLDAKFLCDDYQVKCDHHEVDTIIEGHRVRYKCRVCRTNMLPEKFSPTALEEPREADAVIKHYEHAGYLEPLS